MHWSLQNELVAASWHRDLVRLGWRHGCVRGLVDLGMNIEREIECRGGPLDGRRLIIGPSCSRLVIPIILPKANEFGQFVYRPTGYYLVNTIEIWEPE
jgi:hypothetical protein